MEDSTKNVATTMDFLVIPMEINSPLKNFGGE
jgi:hypothetical protein